MNWRVWHLLLRGFFSIGALSCALESSAQVTFTVSPSVVSNTYSGVIVLQITGVTNGEKVVVEQFVDVNTNGVIDAGEFLIDTFPITESGTSLIGGKTNVNVPRDWNASTTAITTVIPFPNGPGPAIVGQTIFRLFSHDTPKLATLKITNSPLAQTISGKVYRNDTNTPVPYAFVFASARGSSSGTGGAVVADTNGFYQLKINPGTYAMAALVSNTYLNQLIAQVTLTNGQSVVTNLFVTNGTTTISGRVYDATNNNPVGGTPVQVSSGALTVYAFSQSNGTYSASVVPAFWKVRTNNRRLAERAYCYANSDLQVDTSSSSQTNVNVALFKANAMFYGRITDNASVPMVDAEASGSDNNNIMAAKGLSDTNGNYALAVFGGTNWNCQIDTADSPGLATYVVSGGTNSYISSNQTIRVDFTALPANYRISGRLQDNFGNSVPGILMGAGADIGPAHYEAQSVDTDLGGNYSLAVAAGDWCVRFPASSGNQEALGYHGLVDLTSPHCTTVPPNQTLNITVYTNNTPVISSPERFSDTEFGFDVNGTLNAFYKVLVSTNLTNWTLLTQFQLTSNPFSVVDDSATNDFRFYRVQNGP